MSCAALAGRLDAEVRVGDRFPSLAEALSDRTADLPALSGRVVLVDFWASWCAPCKASFPAYAQLHTDYARRGLTIVAVSVDEKPAAFEAFVRQTHPPFATLLDREHRLARLVAVPAMPTCFLVGRDGRVRSMHTGFHGADTERELRREIEAALAPKTASP